MSIIFWYIILIALIVGGFITYLLRNRIERMPGVIVTYNKFIVPFMLLVGLWYILTIKKFGLPAPSDKLNLIGQVSALTFAIFVGLLAFLQLARSSNDSKGQSLKAREQFINPIEKELREVGWWTGLNDNTGGYKPENRIQWAQANAMMQINFGSRVNPLNFSFIENANLLPGLTELANEKPILLDLIAGYLLWCQTFNSYLADIQQFISSQAPENFLVKTLGPNALFDIIPSNFDERETAFANMLLAKYAYLHFDIIGCNETSRLYHYHKRLSEVIKELKESTEQKVKDFEKNNFFGKLYQ